MRTVLLFALLFTAASPALAQRAASRLSAVIVTFEGSMAADPSDPVPDILETITVMDGFLELETTEKAEGGSGRRSSAPRLLIRASFAFESLEAYEDWVGRSEGEEFLADLQADTPPGEFVTTIRVQTNRSGGRGPN